MGICCKETVKRERGQELAEWRVIFGSLSPIPSPYCSPSLPFPCGCTRGLQQARKQFSFLCSLGIVGVCGGFALTIIPRDLAILPPPALLSVRIFVYKWRNVFFFLKSNEENKWFSHLSRQRALYVVYISNSFPVFYLKKTGYLAARARIFIHNACCSFSPSARRSFFPVRFTRPRRRVFGIINILFSPQIWTFDSSWLTFFRCGCY